MSSLVFHTVELQKAPKLLLERFPNPSENRSISRVFQHEFDAYDYYSAAKDAENFLESVESLAMLPNKILKCKWDYPYFVVPLRSKNGKLIENKKVGSHQKTVDTLSGGALRNLTRNSKKLFQEFHGPSVERLLSSVMTFSLTHKSNSIENRLISVWSAVEVLLSEPPINTVRILHYEKLIVPCICLNYVRRKFVAVYDELAVSYRTNFVKIVSKVFEEENLNQHSRFVFLILLPEFEELRKDLFSLISDNPLAMNRIWRLSKDHETPKQAEESITAHENRVKWQIHRIYRARNNLVHAGEIPEYVEGL